MKVLFLAPYPFGKAGSQRFRFEHFFRFQKEWGYAFRFQSFLDEATWEILYKKGFTAKKLIGLVKGLYRRIAVLFTLYRYDLVFIHREALPIGPPIMEWLIAKVFRKKYIFDFDDAIWLPNTSSHNRMVSGLKWHSKTAAICRWAWKISAGNEFLAEYARKYNNRVVVMPTVVDTTYGHHLTHQFGEAPYSIGWTGTHSTISYLENFIPVLEKVYDQRAFKLIVISDATPGFTFPGMEFIPWQKETEAEDLNKIDIGIMPLEDNDWTKGKCGFKAIQYMSLGIPALVSPVGVNKKIVDHEVNGFHCRKGSDWEESLLQLLVDKDALQKMGASAREKIHTYYSVDAIKENFRELIRL